MNICENHSGKTIVLYESRECPLCEMEQELEQAKEEARSANRDADRIGLDNNDLCDKISDLEKEIRALQEAQS